MQTRSENKKKKYKNHLYENKLCDVVGETIEIMSKDSGYIASLTYQIPDDVPV